MGGAPSLGAKAAIVGKNGDKSGSVGLTTSAKKLGAGKGKGSKFAVLYNKETKERDASKKNSGNIFVVESERESDSLQDISNTIARRVLVKSPKTHPPYVRTNPSKLLPSDPKKTTQIQLQGKLVEE
ncbi:hypothetical protein ACOSP7_008159 [Xanthoceras sorbifolium]